MPLLQKKFPKNHSIGLKSEKSLRSNSLLFLTPNSMIFLTEFFMRQSIVDNNFSSCKETERIWWEKPL